MLGQSLGANIFLLGYAYQLGALPLSAEAIERAIALNGELAAMNIAAFRWGRRGAVDAAAVEALARPPEVEDPVRRLSQSFDEMVARRVEFLTAYQNAAYAARYFSLVERARAVENNKSPGDCGLAEAVARYYFKLLAYKDEYEIARLYSDGSFLRQVRTEVGGDQLKLHVHLSPPLIARIDPATGEPRKILFGPWVFPLFRLLAKLKFLRGTAFDPFGWTRERRRERLLIGEYEAMLTEVLAKLTPQNHHVAVGLASIPDKIRGFGYIKMRNIDVAKENETALWEEFRAGVPRLLRAAE